MYEQQDKMIDAFNFLQMPRLAAPTPGAVLAFRVRASSHAAVCNGSGGIIHTDNRTGRVVELSTVPRALAKNLVSVWGLLGVRYPD
jgi:hypothetical protein